MVEVRGEASNQTQGATAPRRLFAAPSEAHLRAARQIMVEPRGVEPLTSCMPCKRSTN